MGLSLLASRDRGGGVPFALVVQAQIPFKKGEPDPNVRLSDLLSDEIYRAGKLNPIHWSMGDPMFRGSVAEGIIKNPPDYPNLQTALKYQKQLKADYLVWVTSVQKVNKVEAEVSLYKDGKPIWGDKQNSGVMVSDKFDLVGSMQAIVRTWSVLMNENALKGIKGGTPIPATRPEPPVYQAPDPNPVIDPIVSAAPTGWKTEIDDARKSGRIMQAVKLARVAVDSNPQDPEPRKVLVEMLTLAGEPALAALEARRASQVFPMTVELRLLGAKAWLQAGNGEEAQRDLSEASARNAQGVDPLLLALANLYQLRIIPATEVLDGAIAAKDSAPARLYRSVARAMQGDISGSVEDLGKADVANQTEAYFYSASAFDKVTSSFSGQVRQLIEVAQTKGSTEMEDGLKFQQQRTGAMRNWLQKCVPNERFAGSHDRRTLAYNLLVQCLADLSDYLKSKDSDSLDEAKISLSEATKQMATAREALPGEFRGDKLSG